MPNLDKETLLSDQQTLVGTAAATTVSTNVFDMGVRNTDTLGNTLPHDLGRSDPEFLMQITEAVLSAGAATVTFDIITSAASNLGSPTIVATAAAVPKATLVAGYKVRLTIPFGLTQRYLGVQFTVNTADTTAGKMTCGIVGAVPTNYVG